MAKFSPVQSNPPAPLLETANLLGTLLCPHHYSFVSLRCPPDYKDIYYFGANDFTYARNLHAADQKLARSWQTFRKTAINGLNFRVEVNYPVVFADDEKHGAQQKKVARLIALVLMDSGCFPRPGSDV